MNCISSGYLAEKVVDFITTVDEFNRYDVYNRFPHIEPDDIDDILIMLEDEYVIRIDRHEMFESLFMTPIYSYIEP
jgi:hypothetical protein